MITQEMIDRINELARKKKEKGLTEEEKKEQQVLYRKYLDAFKRNLRAQLDAIEIVDESEAENSEKGEQIKEKLHKIEEDIEDEIKEVKAESWADRDGWLL